MKNHEETIRRVAILAALYLMPAFVILQPVISDQDVWWHLQTGKWIVEHGVLPSTDPFSTYGEGKPWIVYSWLFEVGMYGLVHRWGEIGVVLYTLVLTWLIAAVLHCVIAKRYGDFVGVSALLALSLTCLSKMFTPRPWLLTILFCSITLEVVMSSREGNTSRWHWCLPLLYIVWANTHIQFIYGLALLGLAIVAPIIDSCLEPVTGSRPMMAWGSLSWRRLSILALLCILATLVTPYYAHLHSVVLLFAGQTGFGDIVQEMQAPPFRSLGDWSMLALFSLTLIRLGWQRTWSSFEVLLIFVASIAAFRGQRDVWFLVLGAITVLAPTKIGDVSERRFILSRGWLIPITCLVSVGVIGILAHRELTNEKIRQNMEKFYPVRAANFIESHGYIGPLYNHFDWGGYLMWRLPQLKVSMDGRGNVQGVDRVKRSIGTWNGGHYWSEDADLRTAEIVILRKELALASVLRLDSRFRLVYEDELAVVFNRLP